jgi:predicted transcriptional regulator YdeE
MNIDVIIEPLQLEVYGFSGTAVNKDYTGTAFKLMDKVWQTVRLHKLENKGMNIWVYEAQEKVFAGLQLNEIPPTSIELEMKTIKLTKYAYYKHVGPYQQIRNSGLSMRQEIKSRGYEITDPYIEIYGHWNKDETKLETELFMSLQ